MRTAVVALALLLAPTLAAAQMYKCTDERGVTAYSDKPCASAKGAQVNIQGQPPLSGKLQERRENLGRDDAEFKRRQAQREREEDKDRAALAQRCAALRQEYGRLASPARRVTQTDASGQRSVMEDAARDKRVAELRDQIRSCP